MGENDSRNQLIFNMWWVGGTPAELSVIFGITPQTIRHVILMEIRDRNLPTHSITTKLRREIGQFTDPPLDRKHMREHVLKAYDLLEKD